MSADKRIARSKTVRWSLRGKRGLGVGMDDEKQEHEEEASFRTMNLNRRTGACCPYKDKFSV